MWYRQAKKFKKKFNIFGLPIEGDKKFKYFAEEESEDETLEQDVQELPFEQSEEEVVEIANPPDIQIEDQTPEDEFTPEDLQNNIEKIENDPTALLQLPPLHNNCHCVVETLPFLSQPGMNDGRRVWKKSENCCEKCEMSAIEFNNAEVQRLLNKGIDMNVIPS